MREQTALEKLEAYGTVIIFGYKMARAGFVVTTLNLLDCSVNTFTSDSSRAFLQTNFIALVNILLTLD